MPKTPMTKEEVERTREGGRNRGRWAGSRLMDGTCKQRRLSDHRLLGHRHLRFGWLPHERRAVVHCFRPH